MKLLICITQVTDTGTKIILKDDNTVITQMIKIGYKSAMDDEIAHIKIVFPNFMVK
jgi:hypothetical protein